VPQRGAEGTAARHDNDEVWVAYRNTDDSGEKWSFKRAPWVDEESDEWTVLTSVGSVDNDGDIFEFIAFTLNGKDSDFLRGIPLPDGQTYFNSTSLPLGLDDDSPRLRVQRQEGGC
jgi:hypothetical protein